MRQQIQYRWRVQIRGKWKTTSFHCTHEDILKEHPEAEPVEMTRRVIEVADTEEERWDAVYNQHAKVPPPR